MKSLTTTFDGQLTNDGTMFDIRAFPNKSVVIKALSFHTSEAKLCDVQIFTKSGSHEYFEETRHAWTEIVNERTQCMGPNIETVIDDETFINDERLGIEKGNERAFYIRIDGTELIYSATAAYDEVYTEDSNLQILEGVGLSKFFKDYVVARMWNGGVYYEVESTSNDDAINTCTNVLKVDGDRSGNNNNFGIMFDIRNKVNEHIEIFGLTIYAKTRRVNYNIYTLSDGFEYGKATLDLWTNIARGRTEGNLGPIIISDGDFDTVNIPPRKRQGFFVTLDTDDLIYRTSPLTMGSTYVQNEMIAVTVGTGVGEPSPPLGSTFYDSRGFYGQILYRTKDACTVHSTVTYKFVVHHPSDWSTERLFGEMTVSMKQIVSDILHTNENLETVVQEHKLEVFDVLLVGDPENKTPCSASSAYMICARVAAVITLTHEKDVEGGVITFNLLENSDKVTLDLNSEFLKVYYAGDEPLDTAMIITLSGVPKKRMGMKQIDYFSKQTKSFLEKQTVNDVVEILSVDVETQKIEFGQHEIDAGEKEIPHTRFLAEGTDTTSIELTTVVTGKHRPPSPGLNFDVLIEDSINADTDLFKEELMNSAAEEEGGSYFQYIEEVRAVQVATLSPTIGPTSHVMIYQGDDIHDIHNIHEKGLSLVVLVLIVVVASIISFACIFGIFIWRRRQLEKKAFKTQGESSEDNEEGPLFYDLIQSRNTHRKKIPPHLNPSLSSKVPNNDDHSRRSDHTPDTGVVSDQSTDNDHCHLSYAREVMVNEDVDDDDVESFVMMSRPSVEQRRGPNSRHISSASSRCSSVISSGRSSSIVSSGARSSSPRSSARSFTGQYGDRRDPDLPRNAFETTHVNRETQNSSKPKSREANHLRSCYKPFLSGLNNSESPLHSQDRRYEDDSRMTNRWDHLHREIDDDVASTSTSSTISTQCNIPGPRSSSRPARR